MPARDTIFALSSGHGHAGVAVIRVSGPAAGSVLDSMAAPRPQPRYAALRRVRHPHTGDILDEALVLWFPAPRSETGEDIAEIHVHGGHAVIRAVLDAIAVLDGCRMAEPGEFVRRAFENGRLDLTAVEGLADLIDADTDAQRRQAVRQAGGALGRIYDGWRDRLIEARALVEAAIDFSDEGDVAADALATGHAQAEALAGAMTAALADANRGEIIRDGLRVVLAGAPNVGKSSLLNALARRDVAIVSPEAGTTRDVIEVRLDLGGYAIVLTDTAGLRSARGPVEAEGIRRTLEQTRRADIVLWMVDATDPAWTVPDDLGARAEDTFVVVNKCDLATPAIAHGAHYLSVQTGQGLDDLVGRLQDHVRAKLAVGSDGPAVITQARHRHLLLRAVTALQRVLDDPAKPAEFQAEDLREAADALGQIVGRIDVEDVLGQIFSRFCIGK